MSQRKLTRLKFFEIEIVTLKYVLNHSESIPIKKNKKIVFINCSTNEWDAKSNCPGLLSELGRHLVLTTYLSSNFMMNFVNS